MKRTSTAVWHGSGKEGSGIISSQSHLLEKIPFAWHSRFETAPGTNPEELLAAAHASCFTMKLGFLLTDAGYIPDIIETTAEVTLETDTISHSHLFVRASVPGITHKIFEECAKDAKENCPMSKVLNAKISLEATLTEQIMA